jgi:hypothetical protein
VLHDSNFYGSPHDAKPRLKCFDCGNLGLCTQYELFRQTYAAVLEGVDTTRDVKKPDVLLGDNERKLASRSRTSVCTSSFTKKGEGRMTVLTEEESSAIRR